MLYTGGIKMKCQKIQESIIQPYITALQEAEKKEVILDDFGF